jgi:PKD repeat protein
MKPSLLLALFFVAILSACARGNPTGPSQQSDEPTPSVQQSNPLAVILAVSPNPTVASEATTFIASPSSRVTSSTWDFGDGTVVYAGPIVPTGSLTKPTFKHIYTRAGTFTTTVRVTNAAGDSASASTTVVVR